MPDEKSGALEGTPPGPSPTVPASTSAQTGPTINIGDEFGTAKRNLPPAKIVLPAIAVVLVIVGIVVFVERGKPQGSGSLDNVVAVEIPGQGSTMVALTFTVRNTAEQVLYVRGIEGNIKTASGESSGDAVSAVDFNRYFSIFPALKDGVQPALSPEAKLQPGETVQRTIIVALPVTLDAFNHRQSVSVVIHPYDQSVPVVLTK
jgi:hypothetical protein